MDVAGFFESFYCCYVLEDVSEIRRGCGKGVEERLCREGIVVRETWDWDGVKGCGSWDGCKVCEVRSEERGKRAREREGGRGRDTIYARW